MRRIKQSCFFLTDVYPRNTLPRTTPTQTPPCASDAKTLPAPDGATWFKQEVHAHDGPLRSYLHRQFPSVRDVDDVVQDSYLRIWKARAAHPIASAKSFLFTIARHLAINVLRRQSIAPVIFDGGLADSIVSIDETSAVELLTEQEKIDLLGDALVALPSRTRDIFILHKFEGLPQAEVARRLGCTEKAVEHQVARAIQLCSKFLRSRGL